MLGNYMLYDLPLISIVVPVYNAEAYIEFCVKSILNQIDTVKEKIEIILVDDGSKDNSAKICDRLADLNSGLIKVIHQENCGTLFARQTGYSAATGKYIMSCDADDFFADNALQDVCEVLAKTEPDVVIFNLYLYKDESYCEEMAKDIFSKEELVFVDKEMILKDYLTSYNTVSLCCKVFSRKSIDLNIDYTMYGRHTIGDDSLITLSVYTHANRFVYLNKALYYYRLGTGTSSSFKEQYYIQLKNVFKEIEKYSEDWNINDINNLLAVNYFSVLGRSITQGSVKHFTYNERKEYLLALEKDDYVSKYKSYFAYAKKHIQKTHRLVCFLLIKRSYLIIHMLLEAKYLLGVINGR